MLKLHSTSARSKILRWARCEAVLTRTAILRRSPGRPKAATPASPRTQRWVLALDLVQNYAAGFRLNGTNAMGGSVQSTSGSSTTIALAPAIEYNFSSRMGLIVGVEFSAAGRNTPSYIAPQMALTTAF